MSVLSLTIYILMWPVLGCIILAILIVCVIKDWRAARRSGEQMV